MNNEVHDKNSMASILDILNKERDLLFQYLDNYKTLSRLLEFNECQYAGLATNIASAISSAHSIAILAESELVRFDKIPAIRDSFSKTTH